MGVYTTVRKFQHERKPVKGNSTTHKSNVASKYKHFKSKEAKQEFKKRMAAGEWFNEKEYEELMDAMKENDHDYCVL